MPEESPDYDVSQGLPEDQEDDDDDCEEIADVFRSRTESLPGDK